MYCYIAEISSLTACGLIGYFKVMWWYLTINFFPAKSFWAGNIAKSMTSVGNSALLPANVDRRPPFRFVLTLRLLGIWYFAEKKQNFAGFSGANSADFAGFLRKKVKFRRIFRGKFLKKSADFTGNFGEKLRQETICKKQPISLDFFGKFR